MAKGLHYSEEELRTMLAKNANIKVHSTIGAKTPISKISPSKPNEVEIVKINLGGKDKNKNSKITLSDSATKKKRKPTNIYGLTKENKEALVQTSVSDVHLSMGFEGSKLLSINQIFALLQNPKLKFSFFVYKKAWHDIIKDVLTGMYIELRNKGQELPFFNDSVELIVFRQAPKLVDEDALTTMFKFIIDALKRTKDNPYGILADDNPKIVHKISCYSEKGPHCVGIKVRLLEGSKKDPYDMEKLLQN
jgi:hypothetical protein